jgi:hypothetical protein
MSLLKDLSFFNSLPVMPFSYSLTGPYAMTLTGSYLLNGGIIYINLHSNFGTSTSADIFTSATGVVPANLRPSDDILIPIIVQYTAGNYLGTLTLHQSGAISITSSLSSGQFPSTGTVGIFSSTGCYSLL